ncbi:uncharacterized protein LOC107493434 [Arachis duranensis]|uniref:Uncharacterized protein LOC107493434 n=1 Tax=Arachis duranensis TaxID=130453 RepID=A0A6P4DP74_ARADU|nr:uncharacterized protein LOC107493434 [Arachis duranensis]
MMNNQDPSSMVNLESNNNDSNSTFLNSDFHNFMRFISQFFGIQFHSSDKFVHDSSSPFLHSDENPETSIVTITLTPHNYHAWSRVMSLAFKGKNKLDFVDGSFPKPPFSDSVIWNDNVADIWKDLRHHYYQGDVFKVAELEEELYSLKRDELSITFYFTKLKAI